jgi:hypothetical protein
MSNKYYILQKWDSVSEVPDIKNIRDLFSDTVLETNMLGKSPLMYDTFDEANKVAKGLDLIFKGKLKSESFVVVKDMTNE